MKLSNLYFILCFAFSIASSAAFDSERIRTWTSADGRTMEARLVSADAEAVKIRRADGKEFTLKLPQISEDDRNYVSDYLAKQGAASRSFKEGPYADAVKSEWVKIPKEKHGLIFQIYASKKLTREKEPVPLVINLHGASARGEDVEAGKVEIAPKQLVREEQYKKTPCVIIQPLCPTDSSWGKHVKELEEIIDSLVASLPIDPNRIYLSGYSMGARGLDSLLMSRPNFYAAAIFADGDANPKWVEKVDTPLWLFYSGERDMAKAEKVVEAYKAAGKEAHFKAFPDAKHNQIHWKLAHDEKVFPWMFEQKRKQPE